MSNTTRIAKNTLALYFRQILIMLVSLYTVRVVLATLGAEDYGIYNVVAGVVTMFGFLSGAMATASQRYFSFEMGKQKSENSEQNTEHHRKTEQVNHCETEQVRHCERSEAISETVEEDCFVADAPRNDVEVRASPDNDTKNSDGLSRIFSVTLTIYVLMALVIIVLAETLGLWFVNHKLVIPEERMTAANVIYQSAIVSFIFTLITTPYMADIIAHENMNIYAYVSIVEAVLKLVIVFALKIIPYDKMIVYGFLLCAVALINTSLYRIYCHKHYAECKLHFVMDTPLFKEMIGYSGWNLFGSFASVVRNQGMTILINLFFGPVVSAARAVASQVNAAVLSFAQNFSTALRPQIIKSYAAGEKETMLRMLMYGTKIVFFLMLIICVPLFFEVPYLMNLWLKNVPEHTVMFVRLVVIDVLIDSISYPVMSVVQATGKIKLYQAVVGGLLIFNLPVSYIFLKLGFPAETVFVVAIALSVVALFLRIIITQKMISFNLLAPFAKLLLLFVVLTALASSVPFVIIRWFDSSLWKFVIFVLISVAWSGLVLFGVGLNRDEKKKIMEKVLRRKV